MKSLIEQQNQIPEMWRLRHKHDTIIKDAGFNYTDNLLKVSMSPVLFNNPITAQFLEDLNSMTVSLLETVLPVRNIFYWSHSPYFNGHGK